MTTSNPILAESRRFAIRLPRPVWIGLAASGLVVTAVWLQFGLPIYRQYVALQFIERCGGTIVTTKCGPTWVRRWFGDERMKIFDEVDCVYLSGSLCDDAGLRRISNLKSVRWLSLGRTRVTDAGLIYIKNLPKLRMFELVDVPITGAGLEYLSDLRELEVLSLERTGVTDYELVNLEWMTSLRELWVSGTNVTETGASDAKRTLPHVHVHFAVGDTREAEMHRQLQEAYARGELTQ